MRRFLFFGFLSGFLLLLFLVLRPVLAEVGVAPPPDTAGRAKELLPEEMASRTTSTESDPRPKGKPGSPMDAVEQQIVAFTNEERRRAGLTVLAADDSLRGAARKHAADMIARGFSDHINPDGLTAEDRLSQENRGAVGTIGETIATATSTKPAELASRIVADWMSNPADRETILRPDSMQLGVGVVPAAGGADVRAVQVVGRIVAVTDAAIPARVAHGRTIRIGTRPVDPATTCNAVDVFSRDTGLTVLGPVPFGEVAMNAPPGVYKLRFHCAAGKTAKVYSGPRFEVTP